MLTDLVLNDSRITAGSVNEFAQRYDKALPDGCNSHHEIHWQKGIAFSLWNLALLHKNYEV